MHDRSLPPPASSAFSRPAWAPWRPRSSPASSLLGKGHLHRRSDRLRRWRTSASARKEENRNPLIKEFVPIAELDDIVFGGWDPISPNALEAAPTAGVLQEQRPRCHLCRELERHRANGSRVRSALGQPARRRPCEGASQASGTRPKALIADIARLQGSERLRPTGHGVVRLDRGVPGAVRSTRFGSVVRARAAGQRRQHLAVADLRATPRCRATCRSPTVRRTSRPTSVHVELSKTRGVPIAGKDFKTGQTLMKTMLAPGFKARMLGVRAGTRPTSSAIATVRCSTTRRTSRRRKSRSSACSTASSQPEVYPDLYGNIDHVVRINYYPPRGDNKEGWDNIDIFGWLGYPDADQGRLPVPRLDPCRTDRARPRTVHGPRQRAGRVGVQEWLSFYLKAPQAAGDAPAESRPVHPADQAEEHPARMDGRAARHPFRGGLIRSGSSDPDPESTQLIDGRSGPISRGVASRHGCDLDGRKCAAR